MCPGTTRTLILADPTNAFSIGGVEGLDLILVDILADGADASDASDGGLSGEDVLFSRVPCLVWYFRL